MQDGHNRRAGRTGMRINRFMTGLVILAIAAVLCAGFLMAQSAPKSSSQTGAPAANLNQLMRGLFFPNSNVIFFTQIHNPAEVQPLAEPSTSTDPLTSVFGELGGRGE